MWFSIFTSSLNDWQLFLFLVGGIVGLSILGLMLVHWSRRGSQEAEPNVKEEEVNKSTFDYLGVMYAVLLGLIIVNSQTKFSTADLTVTNEAAAILSAARDSAGLPEPLRDKVRKELATYTQLVINEDWPFMSTGHQNNKKTLLRAANQLNKLWIIYGTQIVAAPLGSNLMSDLDTISIQRAQRFAINRQGLPDALWLLLLSGSFLMITLIILRRGHSFRFHLRVLLFVCVPLAIFLWLIAQLDNPFGGMITVTPTSMEKALQVLQVFINMPAQHP